MKFAAVAYNFFHHVYDKVDVTPIKLHKLKIAFSEDFVLIYLQSESSIITGHTWYIPNSLKVTRSLLLPS